MDIDQVITLDDGNEYVLLVKTEHDTGKYYLASQMANGEPSDNYEILKELVIDNEFSVETVSDAKLKDELMEKFEEEFDKLEDDENQE